MMLPYLNSLFNVFWPEVLAHELFGRPGVDSRAQHLKEKNQRLVGQRHHCVMSQTRQSRPLSVAMGTATFVANDDIAACVDVLHVPSPSFPACGQLVSLFTVGFVLLEGVAQASVRVRVTRTLTGDCAVSMPVGTCLTDVIRSLRPKCMCRVDVSTRPMPYRQSPVQVSCRHSLVYVRVARQTAE